jgi:hypothetical protein
MDIGYAIGEEIARIVEIVDTPDHAIAEYEIDDEIEDLDTTVAASSDTPQPDKAAEPPAGLLLTPEQTPDPPSTSPAACNVQSMSPASSSSAPPISADFNARNILPEGSTRQRKPRRQIYVAQLADTSKLTAFYAAFATGFTKAKPTEINGPHRDTLPAEPKNWR